MNESNNSAIRVPTNSMAASVQTLDLPTGLYLLSVKTANPVPVAAAANFQLPALNVGLGPGADASEVEFICGPGTRGNWLFRPGNMLIARVTGNSATLLLTSVRTSNGQALDISVRKLGDEMPEVESGTPPAAPQNSNVDKTPDPTQPPHLIGLHLSGHGDLNFSDVEWAGRMGSGTWIEAFSVTPLEFFSPQEIEYKGLTANGFETPWIQGGATCGTRGMAVPVVGFAIRLKGKAAGAYDCEYSGYFHSGVTVGPLRNGAPCRSTISGDPLEGIRLRFVLRNRPAAAAMAPPVAARPSTAKPVEADPMPAPVENPATKPKPGAKKTAAKISAATGRSPPARQAKPLKGKGKVASAAARS